MKIQLHAKNTGTGTSCIEFKPTLFWKYLDGRIKAMTEEEIEYYYEDYPKCIINTSC